MLAFIYTKNKVIRDEEIPEGDIFERLPDNTGRVTRPPEWLGLNRNRVDIDWDDGKFEENPKNGKFFGSNWGSARFHRRIFVRFYCIGFRQNETGDQGRGNGVGVSGARRGP
jgi:hypothetical protein